MSGTTNVNAVSGTATFNALAIDKIGTGYTLTANATGLTGTNSSAFNITNGVPAKLTITTAPQSLLAGVVSSLITVEL